MIELRWLVIKTETMPTFGHYGQELVLASENSSNNVVVVENGRTVEKRIMYSQRILQFRVNMLKFRPAGTGEYTAYEWSEWQDVPTVEA